MAGNKTTTIEASVDSFIAPVPDDRKRADSRKLIELMRTITGADPKMWGSSLVGFGQCHYKYASRRQGDFFITGFSPRKTTLTVCVMPGFASSEDQLKRLGPHKT